MTTNTHSDSVTFNIFAVELYQQIVTLLDNLTKSLGSQGTKSVLQQSDFLCFISRLYCPGIEITYKLTGLETVFSIIHNSELHSLVLNFETGIIEYDGLNVFDITEESFSTHLSIREKSNILMQGCGILAQINYAFSIYLVLESRLEKLRIEQAKAKVFHPISHPRIYKPIDIEKEMATITGIFNVTVVQIPSSSFFEVANVVMKEGGKLTSIPGLITIFKGGEDLTGLIVIDSSNDRIEKVFGKLPNVTCYLWQESSGYKDPTFIKIVNGPLLKIDYTPVKFNEIQPTTKKVIYRDKTNC